MFRVQDLRGVLPALATPLRRDGAVDEPAMGRLRDHMESWGLLATIPQLKP
jgi:dihydrodipicolinate synthase/N-acetylneuraminate lyase